MEAKSISWIGGQHAFVLNIGQLRALQTNCNAGPETVLARIATGTWFIDDLIEPIRLGLIGGGMENAEAGPKVLHMLELHGAYSLKLTAHDVLTHALVGEVDDPVGEPDGVNLQETSGSSPSSTKPEPQ
ncbi:gene transfer agent family protein [Pseudovibrio ascidiaceicola]|uniref:gene transfer agent family protein n=1 Tax=Pseudovibrio ascidiaceicola TaxID=285279 RepID=UPI000D68CC6A|nr:gene transfer agent family protein [Pseudovibrio ascidiaceicola]